MIKTTKGNIFNSKCDAVVIPVNCVGVMGAGLAKQFKDLYVSIFRDYRDLCLDKKVVIGQMVWYEYHYQTYVLFPTKRDWRNPSHLSWIEEGLNSLHKDCLQNSTKSIALPRLGAGLGQLDWDNVRNLIYKEFADDGTILVEVYE